MAGHQINVGLDDIALRKAAKKALDEALKDMRVISEDQLVAALWEWMDRCERFDGHKMPFEPAKLAALLLNISEELEAKSPT